MILVAEKNKSTKKNIIKTLYGKSNLKGILKRIIVAAIPKKNFWRFLLAFGSKYFSENKLIQMDKNVIYQKTKNREIIDEKQLIMIGRVYSDKYNYGAIQDMPKGYGKLI